MTTPTAEELIAAALRERKDGEDISKRLVPPQDADTIAFITIRLHASGTISIQGHVADKRLMFQLLDHARDAINRQIADDNKILVPNRDVDVKPTLPLKEMGDMLPHERGDG